jgi:hypothetical protein
MATKYNTVEDDNFTTAIGGAPSSGDTVMVIKGNRDYSAGTDLDAYDLQRFELTPDFGGRFRNEAGGKLSLVVNQTGTGKFINNSRSPKIELESSSASGVIYEIQHAPALASGLLQVGACDCEMAYVQDGVFIALDGSDIAAAKLAGGKSFFRNSSNALPTVDCYDGSHEIARDITTANIYGGAMRFSDTAVVPATCNIQGGVLEVLECGTISALNGFRGVLDISQSRRPLTISAAVLYPNFRIRLRRGQSLPSWGTPTKPYGEPQFEYVG